MVYLAVLFPIQYKNGMKKRAQFQCTGQGKIWFLGKCWPRSYWILVSTFYCLVHWLFWVSNILFKQSCIWSLSLYFTGINIFDRHNILVNSIGAFPEEIKAYERIQSMIIIGYSSLLVLTVIQITSYYLYNGRFHPFALIVKRSNQYKTNKKQACSNISHHNHATFDIRCFYLNNFWPLNILWADKSSHIYNVIPLIFKNLQFCNKLNYVHFQTTLHFHLQRFS